MTYKYYFIDKEIYYQGKKVEDRKVRLFNANILDGKVNGYDEDGNMYELDEKELIIED